MTSSHAGLRLAARASGPDASPNDENKPDDSNAKGDPKKDNAMSDTKTLTQADVDKASADAAVAATLAANERFNAVMASEHYAGREPLAQKLLGKSDMSASDIIDMLQAAEKKPAAQASELSEDGRRNAAEEGGRAEMREQLGKDKNSDIDAGGGKDGKPAAADASKVWGAAYARVFPNTKAN